MRSIAAGSRLPGPSRYGSSRNWISSSIATIAAVTEPISIAWALARSPLSAKKSMNPKMTIAIRSSTNQSGPGITPTAPWMRSMRAASRSAVWSSHWSYADCSELARGSVVFRVGKARPPIG